MTPFEPSLRPRCQPGALIAALPAMLGFVPETSLVLTTVERGHLGCVMRVDLSDVTTDALAQLADAAAAGGPEQAVVVIVDAEGADCRMCRDDHRELVERATAALGAHGIESWGSYVVDRIAKGGRWHCADGCGGSGTVDDPTSSPMAMAAVLDGRRLYANRADLARVVEPDGGERSARVAELIAGAAHAGASRSDADARRDVEHVMEMARALAAGREVVDDDAARLACALIDPRVRDTVYALAVGVTSDDVEALWARLSRLLPTPWRVHVLVLLAFSAYVRGDGPLAGVALDAALRDDAEHRMANMLEQALRSGMRPEQVRELARTGYRLAERLGVELPPRLDARREAG